MLYIDIYIPNIYNVINVRYIGVLFIREKEVIMHMGRYS